MESHSIELMEGARVLKDRPYPMSTANQKVVEDEIDKMLKLGIIEETKARGAIAQQWCRSQPLTIKDAYPLPSIEGILSSITSSRTSVR